MELRNPNPPYGGFFYVLEYFIQICAKLFKAKNGFHWIGFIGSIGSGKNDLFNWFG